MIDASVEPAPKSSIAIGFAVPGVVNAPKIADSASSPPISTGIPNSFSTCLAMISICRWSDLTIDAIPTACSIENSPARPPFTLIGTDTSTASKSWMNTS